MEKYLLGAAAPSLLPAGAGLGTASIDFDSRSMEISSGEARGGCVCVCVRADPATKRLRQPPARWDPNPGICSQDLIRVPRCRVVCGVPRGCVPSLPWAAARRR